MHLTMTSYLAVPANVGFQISWDKIVSMDLVEQATNAKQQHYI